MALVGNACISNPSFLLYDLGHLHGLSKPLLPCLRANSFKGWCKDAIRLCVSSIWHIIVRISWQMSTSEQYVVCFIYDTRGFFSRHMC